MSDVQLLLATIEDSKTSISKEELEKVHSQVSAVPSEGEGLFWKQSEASQTFREVEIRARKSLWQWKARGRMCSFLLCGANWVFLERMNSLGLGQTG